MADTRRDPRGPIDVRVDTPAREGLTGTAPASLYAPALERDQISVAPDFGAAESQPVWRQDFPIDWPQDQYVERRDFVRQIVHDRIRPPCDHAFHRRNVGVARAEVGEEEDRTGLRIGD